jgi:hypothetical protein
MRKALRHLFGVTDIQMHPGSLTGGRN